MKNSELALDSGCVSLESPSSGSLFPTNEQRYEEMGEAADKRGKGGGKCWTGVGSERYLGPA